MRGNEAARAAGKAKRQPRALSRWAAASCGMMSAIPQPTWSTSLLMVTGSSFHSSTTSMTAPMARTTL